MPRQTKEERKAYRQVYNQTEKGKKSSRISLWKQQGIRVANNNWDTFYDLFLSITHCQKCPKKLTDENKLSHSKRVVDHNHLIRERENVRYICCHACNANDKSTNTSGEPNISYHIRDDCWIFRKQIQGKTYTKSGFKTIEEAIDYKIKFIVERENNSI